jgi:hypothetical protein
MTSLHDSSPVFSPHFDKWALRKSLHAFERFGILKNGTVFGEDKSLQVVFYYLVKVGFLWIILFKVLISL